jgi:Glycosyl transferases group 1
MDAILLCPAPLAVAGFAPQRNLPFARTVLTSSQVSVSKEQKLSSAETGLPRLLYLGNVLPPGLAEIFPECQPTGELIERRLTQSVQKDFETRSVGCSDLDLKRFRCRSGAQKATPNALDLTDKQPEMIHRMLSLLRLRRSYQKWRATGWCPDLIIVCNFSPIYNGFVRWLKGQKSAAPVLVLYLADSASLGIEVPWLKRFRYRFKPLVYPEAEMVKYFDACVAVSLSTETFFSTRGVPWLWLPNGCDPNRALRPEAVTNEGPTRFGYIGSLGAHTGLPDLLRVFTAKERNSILHICGFGKARPKIAAACRKHPGLQFHDPRSPDACVQLARNWDVLLNPRPIRPGNQNNFPSKIFEYALSGRAILSSRVSGADLVLGPEASYFDEHNFESSLDEALEQLAKTPREELNRRGAVLQRRLLSQFSWAQQGERLAGFLRKLLTV